MLAALSVVAFVYGASRRVVQCDAMRKHGCDLITSNPMALTTATKTTTDTLAANHIMGVARGRAEGRHSRLHQPLQRRARGQREPRPQQAGHDGLSERRFPHPCRHQGRRRRRSSRRRKSKGEAAAQAKGSQCAEAAVDGLPCLARRQSREDPW